MTKYFIPKGTSCSRYKLYNDSWRSDGFITTEDVLYEETEISIVGDMIFIIILPKKAYPYIHLSCFLKYVQKIE